MSPLVFMVLAIACFWIGVGTFIPRLCSPLMRGAGTPNHTHSSIPDMSSLLETTKSASVVEASENEVMFSVEGVFAIAGTASLATCCKESVKTYPRDPSNTTVIFWDTSVQGFRDHLYSKTAQTWSLNAGFTGCIFSV